MFGTLRRSGDIFKSKNIADEHYAAFEQWYEQDNSCHYCGISEDDSRLLYFNFPEATRGGKRAKRLELDRKNPRLEYNVGVNNLVLACYWCNNAKTNYFTYEEFKVIGRVIGEVNRERLRLVKECNRKGKRVFTNKEAEKIRKLIDEKLHSTSEQQKGIRQKIRDIGFYYSDFDDSREGYTVVILKCC